MDKSKIFETIDYCYQKQKYSIQLTLTDGKTISGDIPCQVSIFTIKDREGTISPSKSRCFLHDSLIIYYGGIFNEHSIYIPLELIAGISIIDFEEAVIELDLEPSFYPNNNLSANDYIFKDLMSYAKEHQLEIESYSYMYSLLLRKQFMWGDLSYKADVALYADWNYLKNISGGVNSLGAGIGIFSISGGWSTSLWSEFKNKVTQTSIDICDITNESEAVIHGYVTFIEYYPDYPTLKSAVDTVEMEGAIWLPAIISLKKIKNISDIIENQWALAYLRNDGLMFPKDAWERISDPISIFCEVVHSSVATEFGTAPFYLKVRCGAYIAKNKN